MTGNVFYPRPHPRRPARWVQGVAAPPADVAVLLGRRRLRVEPEPYVSRDPRLAALGVTPPPPPVGAVLSPRRAPVPEQPAAPARRRAGIRSFAPAPAVARRVPLSRRARQDMPFWAVLRRLWIGGVEAPPTIGPTLPRPRVLPQYVPWVTRRLTPITSVPPTPIPPGAGTFAPKARFAFELFAPALLWLVQRVPLPKVFWAGITDAASLQATAFFAREKVEKTFHAEKTTVYFAREDILDEDVP